MSVAFNNTNAMTHGAASPYSVAKSVTAGGSNVVAFAIVSFTGLSAASSITSVTYGGDTMTPCGAAFIQSTTPWASVQVFYKINPKTGSNTLTITGDANIDTIKANLVSFSGVDQKTPVRPSTYTGSTGSVAQGTGFSVVVTSNAQDLTLSMANDGNSAATGIGTNQTSDGTLFQDKEASGSDHCTTPGTSITHTWTSTGSGTDVYAICGFSIQAGGGPAGFFGIDRSPAITPQSYRSKRG